jgi:hypothetical protein
MTRSHHSFLDDLIDVYIGQELDRAERCCDMIVRMLHDRGHLSVEGGMLAANRAPFVMSTLELILDAAVVPSNLFGHIIVNSTQVCTRGAETPLSLPPEVLAMQDDAKAMMRGRIVFGGNSVIVAVKPLPLAGADRGCICVGFASDIDIDVLERDALGSIARIVVHAVDGDERRSISDFMDETDRVARRIRTHALHASSLSTQLGDPGRALTVVAREIGALSDRLSSSTDKLKERLAMEIVKHRMLQVPRRRFTA